MTYLLPTVNELITTFLGEVFLGKELKTTVYLLASGILVFLGNTIGQVVLWKRMSEICKGE